MKKLFVAVALVMGLGTSVAFAENFHASVDSVNIVNEFKPIEVKDLPQAVLDAVTKDSAGTDAKYQIPQMQIFPECTCRADPDNIFHIITIEQLIRINAH